MNSLIFFSTVVIKFHDHRLIIKVVKTKELEEMYTISAHSVYRIFTLKKLKNATLRQAEFLYNLIFYDELAVFFQYSHNKIPRLLVDNEGP